MVIVICMEGAPLFLFERLNFLFDREFEFGFAALPVFNVSFVFCFLLTLSFCWFIGKNRGKKLSKVEFYNLMFREIFSMHTL